MSIITFNKSTIDRNDFITNTQPYQIVPLHDKFFYKVATNAILNAQDRVTGMLYKFFIQVHNNC